MISIRILMLGKSKDSWVEEAVQGFAKQLRPFCNLDLIYIKDEKVHDNVQKVLDVEAERLEKQIKADEYLVVLDDKGKGWDTETFSSEMEKLTDRGEGKFVFIIGSAHGLAEKLKQKADLRLSLSPMTMNHQLVRLVLLEQLYRIFTLQRGIAYHK